MTAKRKMPTKAQVALLRDMEPENTCNCGWSEQMYAMGHRDDCAVWAEVEKLERFVNGREYVAIQNRGRGIEFALVIPWDRWYGTPCYKILWRSLRIVTMAIWGKLF